MSNNDGNSNSNCNMNNYNNADKIHIFYKVKAYDMEN